MVWMVTRLNVSERGFAEPLAQRLTVAKSSMGVTLYWLGEAGLIIQARAKSSRGAQAHWRNERLSHPRGRGQTDRALPGLSIVGLRAAHEALESDIEGNHRFLGV
jgi:hypothetical protein